MINKKNVKKFNNRKTHKTPLEISRVQPQAIDLEKAILGDLLSENKNLPIIPRLLKEEVFYKKSHQLIFKAIKELYDE